MPNGNTTTGKKSWFTAMLVGVAVGVLASGYTAIAVAITEVAAN